MEPLIHIIVPVFNVEKYLHKCVDSIINQTYKHVRIILVDDGSPDNCPQICDEYAKKDERVIVIHQPNAGLSSARNAGLAYIENAGLSSENVFVGFCDSDDWIAPDMIGYCVNLINQYDADTVEIGVELVYSEKEKTNNPKESISLFSYKDILQNYMTTTTTTGSYSVCRCLFRAHVIEHLRFRVGKINEDIDFKYQALSRCKKKVVSNQKKYFYRQGHITTSSGGLKKKDYDLYDAANILSELTSKETYGNIAWLGKVKKARTPFSLLCKIAYFGVADPSLNKKQIINTLTKEHRKNVITLLKSPIPVSRKILAILFAFNYQLAELCVRIAK